MPRLHEVAVVVTPGAPRASAFELLRRAEPPPDGHTKAAGVRVVQRVLAVYLGKSTPHTVAGSYELRRIGLSCAAHVHMHC